MKLTPKNVAMKKGNQRLYKQEKNMANIVKQMESKDTDVLNCLASGKSVDQSEWDILFTFNIGTEEAENLTIKRNNKRKDGIAKENNIMEISLDIYLKKKTLQEIQSLKPASQVNWQGMVRKYQINTKNGVFPMNGGQILKEFAKENGINTNHFNKHVSQWTRLSPTCKA